MYKNMYEKNAASKETLKSLDDVKNSANNIKNFMNENENPYEITS